MEYEFDLKDLSDAYLNDGAIKEIDEVYRKAEAFDRLYAEFDKGDKDLSKADFDAVYKEADQ